MINDRTALLRILNQSGLQVDTLEDGKLIRCKAEGDRGGAKSGWYCLFDEGGSMACVFGDWRSGERGIWFGGDKSQTPEQRENARRLIAQARQDRRQEQERQWASNRVKLMALWNSAAHLTERDAAGRYLLSRGLAAPVTGALRFHAGLDYWHDGECIGRFPAMLAAVTSPAGELVTLHRTFLTMDGRKAPVDTPKKLCPAAGPMGGASIKIGQAITRNDERLCIGVAEGIETSIAASILFGLPVWSSVSAGGLASFAPPPAVRNVYVFADNDASRTGQKAAAQLSERLTRQGFTVRTHTPPTIGDWLDELNSMKVAV